MKVSARTNEVNPNTQKENSNGNSNSIGNRPSNVTGFDGSAPVDTRNPKMLEAAKMFEQEFLRHMVAEMRKTVQESDFLPEGMGGKIFKEQLDQQYVDNWVEQGGVGLADQIYTQLSDQIENSSNRGARAFKPGETVPLPNSMKPVGPQQGNLLRTHFEDLLFEKDQARFLARRKSGEGTGQGISVELKASSPLTERVQLRAPFSGTVKQVLTLDSGESAVILESDKGPAPFKAQIVHSGLNKVREGQTLFAGQPLAELGVSTNGQIARASLSLRYLNRQAGE